MDNGILTKRLMIRPVMVEDARDIFRFSGDPENAQYMIFLPFGNLEEVREDIERSIKNWNEDTIKVLDYSIIKDGNVIGTLSLYYYGEPDWCEIGWIIDKVYWHQGYAVEAAKALMEYAFKEWDLSYMIATCDSRNTASRGLMEKLGFVLTKDDGIRYDRLEPDEPATELTYTFVPERQIEKAKKV